MEEASILRKLANLHFECTRCGVVIEHESDPELVQAVAASHCNVAHRKENMWLGDMTIAWSGYADIKTQDEVREAVCEAPPLTDLWVDESGVMYEAEGYNGEDATEEMLRRVAAIVGPDLTVIDRRRP